jgi:hypothetical protein
MKQGGWCSALRLLPVVSDMSLFPPPLPCGGVRLSPRGTWPIVPVRDVRQVCRILWNENWQGKPKYLTETRHSTKIPHCLTWDRTRAVAVGSRWLTAWVMARTSDFAYSSSSSETSGCLQAIGCYNTRYFTHNISVGFQIYVSLHLRRTYTWVGGSFAQAQK